MIQSTSNSWAETFSSADCFYIVLYNIIAYIDSVIVHAHRISPIIGPSRTWFDLTAKKISSLGTINLGIVRKANEKKSGDTEKPRHRGESLGGMMIDAAEGSISQLQGGEDGGKTKTFQGDRKRLG